MLTRPKVNFVGGVGHTPTGNEPTVGEHLYEPLPLFVSTNLKSTTATFISTIFKNPFLSMFAYLTHLTLVATNLSNSQTTEKLPAGVKAKRHYARQRMV